jgi:hypothetical protein
MCQRYLGRYTLSGMLVLDFALVDSALDENLSRLSQI